MDLLAPDVVVIGDGGGVVPAFRRPIEGRERALAVFSRFAGAAPETRIATLLVNGAVAARIDLTPDYGAVVTFVIEAGQITRIYAIGNPAKLGRPETVADLRR